MTKHPTLKNISDTYKDFEVIKSTEITELQCFLTELVHVPTGARVMHIGNEDAENLFCLSFQTLPDSSNGVAHILEHTVLCGSEKFPVKDPFFAMTRRSLNTYMNALTGQDFTCYPASSQVTKDFYNLLEVYLDAVFKPHLSPLSFLQEGHRLEFVIPDDPTSDLEYKGIVFNEMKGAMNSPMSLMGEAINKALFPDITYGHNSGGDPEDIPNLSFAELVSFHKKYYHPSRCLFFFYGNLPLSKHLDFLKENILDETKKIDPLPPMDLQKRFASPKKVHQYYPVSENENLVNKAMIALCWLTYNIKDQKEILALCILDIILMDNDGSPLKLALLKSGLCKSASAYIDIEVNETPFVLIMKGCKKQDADALELLVRTTLKEIIEKGIPLEQVENAMHQLEIFRSEITGDHVPFGLSLFMRSGLLKQHHVDPVEGLEIHSLFDRLRKELLKDPKYLTDILQKQLLDNNHFVQVTLEPDTNKEKQKIENERNILAAIKNSMDDKAVKEVLKQTKILAEFQKAQEDTNIDVLPTLTMEDIPVAVREYPITKEKQGSFNLYHHACFTNDIVYIDVFFDLPALTEEELSLTRLFSIILPQVGCGGKTYVENLDRIQAHTGGIHTGLSLNIHAEDFNRINPNFSLKGKALKRKMHELCVIMKDMIIDADFDDAHRLKEIIEKHFVGLESSFTQNALRYATNLSASNLSLHSHIANEWYGINYFEKIKEIATHFDSLAPTLIKKFKALKEKLLATVNPDIVVAASAQTIDELKANHFYGLTEISLKDKAPWQNDFTLTPVKSQGRAIASPVAFISKVFGTVPYVSKYSPALSIAAFLFDNLHLHAAIREQGGAYGGGAVNNTLSGNFYFYSYRDPNISSTLAAFEAAIQEVAAGNFSDEDLLEAKMEMIQGMDSPVAPGSRAELGYNWIKEGKTTKIRQQFRDIVLSLTKEDIITAVKNEIIPNWQKGASIVFAGKDLLEKENKLLQDKGLKTLPIVT